MEELGWTPLPMRLKLTSDSDFFSTLVNEERPWPVGTSIRIEVAGFSWPAVITGTDAAFHATEAQVNAVIATKPQRWKLKYQDAASGADLTWATGPVVLGD